MLKDDEPADVSYERQLRMVASLTDTIQRNVPGCSLEDAEACARNIASAYPILGMVED